MISYKSKHFTIKEFVPYSIFQKYGEQSLLFMDSRIVEAMDLIRDHFNKPVRINDWATGGNFQWRGFRNSVCREYLPSSQHSFGRAIDFNVEFIPAETIRQTILDNSDKFFMISAMEKDVPWVHIDCRNLDNASMLLFNK